MKSIFFFFLFSIPLLLLAQQEDSLLQQDLPVPDLQLEKANTGPKTYSPRQALIWSAIPAGGQIYNRRWWKVPLVYGGFASMVAAVDYNHSNFKRFQEAYELKLADQTHEFTGTRLDDPNQLRVLRNNFDKNRQTSYVGLFLVYALQGVEAFVDAHLRDFDIDDDLSQNWQIRPGILSPSPGAIPKPVVTFSLQF